MFCVSLFNYPKQFTVGVLSYKNKEKLATLTGSAPELLSHVHLV